MRGARDRVTEASDGEGENLGEEAVQEEKTIRRLRQGVLR